MGHSKVNEDLSHGGQCMFGEARAGAEEVGDRSAGGYETSHQGKDWQDCDFVSSVQSGHAADEVSSP